MSDERKKLLSVTNLKKYFPIAKSSIFQRHQLYVRANEDISFDVYEGETIGIVGESGCGKSTLGRVILQLYDQTAGTTMYYGRSRSEVAPKYVRDTLNNVRRYTERYRRAQAKADKASEECAALGKDATFFQLQQEILLKCAAKKALTDVASIVGGFMAVSDNANGIALLKKRHAVHVAIAQNNKKVGYNLTKIELLEEKKSKSAKQKQTDALEGKMPSCTRPTSGCSKPTPSCKRSVPPSESSWTPKRPALPTTRSLPVTRRCWTPA